MYHSSNPYNQSLLDFFKSHTKNASKSSLSNEKTLPIKSPSHNNFFEKTQKAKKHQSQQQKFIEKMLCRPCEGCSFCVSLKFRVKAYLMLSAALQVKHTPNLHYHVTKNINDILQNKRTAKVISYRDMIIYNEEQECLKRFYTSSEQPSRLKNLTEFYQYHNEIPKLHIYSLRRVLKRYHTKKRKLEYVFVRKLLGFSVNNDIMESSYEPKPDEDDSSLNREKNIGKNVVSNILKDISIMKDPSFRRMIEERKSSINFNEFSHLLQPKDPCFEASKDLPGLLQKLTENSFELVFKPRLPDNPQPSPASLLVNNLLAMNPGHLEPKRGLSSKKEGLFNRKEAVLGQKNGGKSAERGGGERKVLQSKSNTERNYDFKLKTTRKTINLATEPIINSPKTVLSPKTNTLKVNTDRNSRSQSKDLVKSTSITLKKARTSPFSAKISNKISIHSAKTSCNLTSKNKLILSKKHPESLHPSNNHLRFFSLNGYDSSLTNRLESSAKDQRSPTELKGIKVLKNNTANFLINKNFVKAHLEEFLLRGSQGLQKGLVKKTNLELLQGKNTQSLFKKIYQNDVKSPNKMKT